MVKLWHSLLPQAIVVYPHWKTMEIQAVKAERVLASPSGRTPNGPNPIDLSLRLDLGSRPQRAKGSIFSLPNSLAAYLLLYGHSVGPQAHHQLHYPRYHTSLHLLSFKAKFFIPTKCYMVMGGISQMRYKRRGIAGSLNKLND